MPSVRTSQFSPPMFRQQVSSYAEVASRADQVRQLLLEHNLRVHRDSTLATVLRDAQRLATGATEGEQTPEKIRVLVNAAHADRVCSAFLSIVGDPLFRSYLKRVSSNPIDLSLRNMSQGKDALWEIALLATLRSLGIDTAFQEPPDIVASLCTGGLPIACKKIYSEAGVEAQLRKGVSQLARAGTGGLVALNIDDLVPEDVILRGESVAATGEFLSQRILEFIDTHRMVLQRYVHAGRCDGVLISISVLAGIALPTHRLNNYTETAIWTLDSIAAPASARIAELRSVLSHQGN